MRKTYAIVFLNLFAHFERPEIVRVFQMTPEGQHIAANYFNPYDCEAFLLSKHAFRIAKSSRKWRQFAEDLNARLALIEHEHDSHYSLSLAARHYLTLKDSSRIKSFFGILETRFKPIDINHIKPDYEFLLRKRHDLEREMKKISILGITRATHPSFYVNARKHLVELLELTHTFEKELLEEIEAGAVTTFGLQRDKLTQIKLQLIKWDLILKKPN